ncbi:uncharacterized protein LOC119448031 [Dermacentor silvarum]|uniref:uncharacterized protein LOC119448031 n=1 Tax=Dermacentor silvarum TaxID=543639 RepID=UPI0018974213|nr:uncharacterized protein LOC119448031 [Dermacentor silvarum]
MHVLSAAVFFLLLLMPTSGQLLDGLRNPLWKLFGRRGGDPDSDGGRTELHDDPLPDMIPNHAPAVVYRRMPSVVMEPAAHLGDAGYFYSRRPVAHMPGAARLPPVGSRRWQSDGYDHVPLESRFAGKAESSKDTAASPEDRMIEALKLIKQLRTMAT